MLCNSADSDITDARPLVDQGVGKGLRHPGLVVKG